MARLPSAVELGGLPSASSGRQVSSIDASAIGEGMQAVGRGMMVLSRGQQAMGQGVSQALNNLAGEQRRKELLAENEIESKRTIERLKLSEAIDNENDPARVEQLRSQFGKIDQDFASKIPDPVRRQEALNKWNVQTAEADIRTGNRFRRLTEDRTKLDADNLIEAQRRLALGAKSPEARNEAIRSVNEQYDRLFQAGIIKSPQELAMRKRKFADDYSWDRFNLLPSNERLEAATPVQVGERSKTAFQFFRSKGWSVEQAAGIVGNLIHESVGLRTGAINRGDGQDGSDSVGLAQWNSDRAKNLQAFAASKGKDWRDFQTQLEFVDYELNTAERKASERLRTAATPREAAAAFAEYFLRPAGAGSGTPEALHGWKNRAKQSEAVASQFGGMKFDPTEADKMFSLMPPERQAQARQIAERDYVRENQALQRQQREQAAEVNRQIADDIASIEATGKEVQGLTRDTVTSVLGDKGVAEWEAQRERARRTYTALNGIETLSEAEVEQRLKSLEPAPGSPGFAEDMKTYQKADAKAKKFLEARRADPALAVDAFDAVRQVRAAAEYEGDGERRTIKPESAQAVVRARLAAQNQLGIPEPMAVTRSEARTIARQLRYIGDDDAKGMERFVRQLQATYGDYADEVLVSTLQLENVNRDLAVLATEVINRVAVGKVPSLATARQLEIATENQAVQGALNGVTPPAPRPAVTGREATMALAEKAKAARAPKPGEAEPVTFDAEDIRWLDKNRANPDALFSFDNKYGPKMAQRILADIDRRKGVAQ